MFQSGATQNVFGFTRDENGGNLPAEFSPWRRTGSQTLPAGTSPRDPLVQALTSRGYYIARASEVG